MDAFQTLPLEVKSEAEVRALFARFDADRSGRRRGRSSPPLPNFDATFVEFEATTTRRSPPTRTPCLDEQKRR